MHVHSQPEVKDMRFIAEARVPAVLLVFLMAFAITAPAKAETNPTVQTCKDSVVAVAACTAYLSATHFALQPYYKLVSNGNLSHVGAKAVFDAAYSPGAQATILLWAMTWGRSINNWPVGLNKVPTSKIEFFRVVPHPACDRTLLITRESWMVIGSNNKVLYSENKRFHTVVLDKYLKQVLFVAKGRNLKLAGCS